MKVVVGLGNPGAQYANTPHSVGFEVVDRIAAECGAVWEEKRQFRCLMTRATFAGQSVLLVKPQTYMNLSGLTVQEAMSWYKLEPKDVLILVDDIDLPFGQVRVRAKGGPGTHNGLRHIVQCTGSGDFPRVRVGMGAPPPEWDLADWVLSKFQTEEERKIAFDAYMTAADAALCWAENGIDVAMNRFNKRHAE